MVDGPQVGQHAIGRKDGFAADHVVHDLMISEQVEGVGLDLLSHLQSEHETAVGQPAIRLGGRGELRDKEGGKKFSSEPIVELIRIENEVVHPKMLSRVIATPEIGGVPLLEELSALPRRTMFLSIVLR